MRTRTTTLRRQTKSLAPTSSRIRAARNVLHYGCGVSLSRLSLHQAIRCLWWHYGLQRLRRISLWIPSLYELVPDRRRALYILTLSLSEPATGSIDKLILRRYFGGSIRQNGVPGIRQCNAGPISDVVEVEIERTGRLQNLIRYEQKPPGHNFRGPLVAI
jgi:hypothetical protein